MFKKKNKKLELDASFVDTYDDLLDDSISEEYPKEAYNEGDIVEEFEMKKNVGKKKKKKKKAIREEYDDEEEVSGRNLGADFLSLSSDENDEKLDISDFDEEDLGVLKEYLSDIIKILGFVKIDTVPIVIDENGAYDVPFYVSKEKDSSLLRNPVQAKYSYFINIPFKVESGLFQVEEEAQKDLISEEWARKMTYLNENLKLHFQISQIPLNTDNLSNKYDNQLTNTLYSYENQNVKEKLSRHLKHRKESFISHIEDTSEMSTMVVLQIPTNLGYEDFSDKKLVAKVMEDGFRNVMGILSAMESSKIISDFRFLTESGIKSMLVYSLTLIPYEFKDATREVNISKENRYMTFANITSHLQEAVQLIKYAMEQRNFEARNDSTLTERDRKIIKFMEQLDGPQLSILETMVNERALPDGETKMTKTSITTGGR